ncbi:MAG TPA: hypothetical protein VF546_02170 [Pyrinomonadaceae bacterium]|jgi:hypothetical protein
MIEAFLSCVRVKETRLRARAGASFEFNNQRRASAAGYQPA